MKTSRGFTLVEAVIVLAISSIILAMASNAWQHIRERSAARNSILMLANTLASARHAAQTLRTPVSLCGSGDGISCNQQWQHGILVFLDRAGTGSPATSADILSFSQSGHPHARMTWRGFGSSRMGFDARGLASASNGTFTYCPSGTNPAYARQIVLNRGGRARFSRDRDGDGIHEDASGNALTCR